MQGVSFRNSLLSLAAEHSLSKREVGSSNLLVGFFSHRAKSTHFRGTQIERTNEATESAERRERLGEVGREHRGHRQRRGKRHRDTARRKGQICRGEREGKLRPRPLSYPLSYSVNWCTEPVHCSMHCPIHCLIQSPTLKSPKSDHSTNIHLQNNYPPRGSNPRPYD